MTKNIVKSKMVIEEENKPDSMKHGNSHANSNHDQHNQYQKGHQQPSSMNYNINLKYDPVTPEAGKATKLILSVTEQRSGVPVKEYEFVHDKLMHLIIVGEDLSYFAHIHPRLEDSGENFIIFHEFPESGIYKMWVDFKPKGGNQTLVTFMVEVKGLPPHNLVVPVYDGIYIKESSDRNYQISLKLPEEKLIANKDVDIVFSISDVAGNPIMDLEPLMGAGGHSVIISGNIQEFLHVHPSEEVDPNWKGGPHISFRTNFLKPGLYKVWGQFQHKGKVIMANFILEVA